jgi:YesN/AraC family two-component response regulator
VKDKTMKKILVIEELAETRNFFLASLQAEGFYTMSAENGQSVIERVQEELPDLIISETITPKIDGYGVLSALRQNPITAIIPFIFVTARKTWTDIRKAMELGADDYLTKPCTIEELLRAIATQLEKQITQKQWYARQSFSADAAKPKEPQSNFASDSQIGKVFQFIESNYARAITLSDVAQAVGYSPAYLTDLMRRKTGKSIHRWIVEHRMKAACFLLSNSDRSVEQIAELVGYRYTGCLFRQFRQSFGTTPQIWRQENRNQIANG